MHNGYRDVADPKRHLFVGQPLAAFDLAAFA